jgi:putative ABC transport system substrate-binding protein
MSQLRRRQLLIATSTRIAWLIGVCILGLLVTLAAPLESWAQSTERVFKVGFVLARKPLPPNEPLDVSKLGPMYKALMDRLAKHGYVEGKNLALEARFGDYEQLPAFAAEMVRLKVDVIFTTGGKAGRIVQGAVKTTPVVIQTCDPFEHVVQLARPGSNVTGVTCMTSELSPKRLELLKELLPKASRVVFFSDPEDAPLGLKLTRNAAPKLGIKLREVAYKGRASIADALSAAAKERPDALFVYPDPILFQERQQIADFALSHGLPTMHAFPEFADAGGLMSYGSGVVDQYVMVADQIAKILGGARPSDVPVQRATKFYLVINMKTAKALNIKVPQPLLLRADRVIE